MKRILRRSLRMHSSLMLVVVLGLSVQSAGYAQQYDRRTRVVADDAQRDDLFGYAVAIDGDLAAVGMDPDNLRPFALVYIYKFDGSAWNLQAKLPPPDSVQFSGFGSSLAINNNSVIAGNPRVNSDRGSAFVFSSANGTWQHTGTLVANDGASGDQFGRSVSIHRDIAVIGAPQHNAFRGAAYVFRFDGTAWTQEAKLTPSDNPPSASFGTSVSILDGTIAVGAPGDSSGSGSAYIFTSNGASWEQRAKLRASDRRGNDNFGTSLSTTTSTVLVGAPSALPSNGGAAYVFQFNGITWSQHSKLAAFDAAAGDRFGGSVFMNGDIAAISADADSAFRGSVYLFRFDGSSWVHRLKILSPAPDQASFGTAVGLSENSLIVGTPYERVNNVSYGSAYIYELIARPGQVNISDGLFSNRARVGWANRSNSVQNFRIYRDGEEIDNVSSGATSYNDYNATPGRVHTYAVSAYNNTWGESFAPTRHGWRQANGRMDGSVRTRLNAGSSGVDVSLVPTDAGITTALDFDGQNDWVNVPDDSRLSLSTWTLEAAILPRVGAKEILYRAPSTRRNYELQYESSTQSVSIAFQDSTGSPYVLSSTNNSVPLDQWTSVAGTFDGMTLRIYINGSLNNFLSVSGIPQRGSAPLWIGRGDDGYFHGTMREVRLWNTARDSAAIRGTLLTLLQGNEAGLVGYWPLNDSSQSVQNIAADLAQGGGHHGSISGATWIPMSATVLRRAKTDANGDFSIRNVFYGDSREFRVTPVLGTRGFDPASRLRTLDLGTPSVTGVSFTDTSSFSVIGRIQFAGTACNVDSVKIAVQGEGAPLIPVYSGADGVFRLSISQAGVFTIRPSFGDAGNEHAFQPAETTLTVADNIVGLDFKDTQRRLLFGKVRGGCDAIIGTGTLRVYTAGNTAGCFDTTFTTDASGNFRVFLPAQKYIVELTGIVPPNPLIISYFSPQQVDLRHQNVRQNFIYRRPPFIRVSGWPDFGCGAYQVPIVVQHERYNLLVEVLETYGSDTCHVDAGYVIIHDNIGGNPSNPDTLLLVNGQAIYRLVGGLPNILGGGSRPFQKLIQFEAKVGQETATLEQWSLVTGHRPRERTFVSTSPELPLYILRDPPGDQSYSFLQRDTVYATQVSSGYERDSASGVFLDFKIGAVITYGGIGSGTDFGAYAIFKFEGTGGGRRSDDTVATVALRTTQEFRTSDGNLVVGSKGDVFVGAAFNNIYALTDVIEYNMLTCQVERDTSLAWSTDSILTSYVYTEDHIRNTLIPQLRELRSVSYSQGDSLQANRYSTQIEIWEQTLSRNDSLKQGATFKRNISFSGGTSTSYTSTTESSRSIHIEWSEVHDREFQLGLGVVLFGTPYEGGYKSKWSWTIKGSSDTTISTATTVGYTLADQNPGDFFSVNVKDDGVYSAPVFETVAGRSSCPWEEGTQPRDGVQLTVDPFLRTNVPPDQQATYTLALGNTSQSGETREYYLSVLQESNLDGAVIRVGGVVVQNFLSYVIPAGQQLTATMTVERGPIAFDYNDLKVRLYSPCDPDIADTVTFSARFTSVCSNVNLLFPENNWLVNISSGDSVQVVITNYNANNINLQSIGFQYRRLNPTGNWTMAFLVPRDSLPSEGYILRYWNVSSLADGNYEVRAVTDCGTRGKNYSAIASGVIDRHALVVLGAPQPSDGVLNIGESIRIEFSGNLSCGLLSSGRNALLIIADDSTSIPFTLICSGNSLTLSPTVPLSQLENRLLTARVVDVSDVNGNVLRQPVSWTFRVNQNPVFWTVANVQQTVYQGEPNSIRNRLRNAGGQDEQFNVSRYPVWLTPNVLNGIIPPGGEREILLAIDEQLNVGEYQDTVVVQTSQGEARLLVSVTVFRTPPSWAVNPAQFTFNMSITAQVAFEDTLSRDVLDRVAVFVNSEVRGVANLQYNSTVNKHLAFITVHSNIASGEQLTFRMWDASRGREYAQLGGGYTFQSNGSYGTPAVPVVLNGTVSVLSVNLAPGWTWFSSNVLSPDMSVRSLLSGALPSSGDLIKGQESYSQYHTGIGWAGSLDSLKIGKSYRISKANQSEIQFVGSPVSPSNTIIPIDTGWNWIGYLEQRNLDVNDALASLPATEGDIVKSQTEFAQYNTASRTWEGSLRRLVPGQGYLLKSNAGGTLHYRGVNTPNSTGGSFTGVPAWQVRISSYEFSMSITGVVTLNGVDLADSSAIVGAFVGETCRGLSSLKYIPGINRYAVFLLVYSNVAAGDTVRFKVYSGATDKIRDIDGFVLFTSDGIIGDLSTPHVFSAMLTGDDLIPREFYLTQNFPNPFNPATTIEYGLSNDAYVTLALYNVLGQRVRMLVDEQQKAGTYRIIFNSTAGLASGVYFYQIEAGNFVRSRKMLLLK